MQKFLRICLSAALLTLSLGWSGLAHAETAQNYLKAKQAELTVLVSQPPADGDQKLKATFDDLLDYDTLAKDSLGDQWAKLSPAEQKEFQSLLMTLVQRAYTKSIRDTLAYDIEFKGESEAKAGKVVHTVARHKTDQRKDPITIDYLAHQVGGKWRVFDIVTEGSSLVANYKSQFKRIIDKSGFTGLVEKMKTKAAEK
ncbi:MAG TPA: ABC transporter substrate-binding protein [Polyangiaceae bacterium]|nr:ABC transporter substrate-binding protein [Polyangiaceae bacterium]